MSAIALELFGFMVIGFSSYHVKHMRAVDVRAVRHIRVEWVWLTMICWQTNIAEDIDPT